MQRRLQKDIKISRNRTRYAIDINIIESSSRVSLVVAVGFLVQNFGRWLGPMNCTLSFYECRLSDGEVV